MCRKPSNWKVYEKRWKIIQIKKLFEQVDGKQAPPYQKERNDISSWGFSSHVTYESDIIKPSNCQL